MTDTTCPDGSEPLLLPEGKRFRDEWDHPIEGSEMKMTSLFAEQLEIEGVLTKRALERVPEDKHDWKPHPKSMEMGRLAYLVANILSWTSLIVEKDELDIQPEGGGESLPNALDAKGLVAELDKAVREARTALASTNDAHLMTAWKLLAKGKVRVEKARYAFITENFHHLAHHRGQLTVYLRMNEVLVPSIYGPSADDKRF